MIGWFDAEAGASGDMMLAALVSAGVPLDVPQAAIDALDIGVTLRAEQVQRGSLGSLKVHVDVPETRTVRHLPDIFAMFKALPTNVAELAGAVFTKLGEAEAAVHQMPLEQVHFHEVGALDSIADIVGAAAAVDHLGLDQIVCSTLSLGSGHARGAHGPLPVPVPAVLQLTKGVAPVQAGPAPYESTTPTGAALLVTIADAWGPMPPMQIDRIGMGAGTKDTDVVANVLRLVVGAAV